jgi:hypothetical protein
MRARAGRAALITIVAVAAVFGGCAGRRLDHGIFRSEHGYRITVPGPEWTVVNGSAADLELRRPDRRAGMLAAATCQRAATRQRSSDLSRHLLLGLRERETLEEKPAVLAGRRGVHAVVEGRMRDGTERVRIESYTVKDARCVYDFLYVAPPASFEASRDDFARFVGSFSPDR